MPLPYDVEKRIYQFTLLIGILIVIYAVLWILAKLGLIPLIVFALFPQIVLLAIGIFIIYIAYKRI